MPGLTGHLLYYCANFFENEELIYSDVCCSVVVFSFLLSPGIPL
jgi:hypothetical protein